MMRRFQMLITRRSIRRKRLGGEDGIWREQKENYALWSEKSILFKDRLGCKLSCCLIRCAMKIRMWRHIHWCCPTGIIRHALVEGGSLSKIPVQIFLK